MHICTENWSFCDQLKNFWGKVGFYTKTTEFKNIYGIFLYLCVASLRTQIEAKSPKARQERLDRPSKHIKDSGKKRDRFHQ